MHVVVLINNGTDFYFIIFRQNNYQHTERPKSISGLQNCIDEIQFIIIRCSLWLSLLLHSIKMVIAPFEFHQYNCLQLSIVEFREIGSFVCHISFFLRFMLSRFFTKIFSGVFTIAVAFSYNLDQFFNF
jgi:hypothetical protein